MIQLSKQLKLSLTIFGGLLIVGAAAWNLHDGWLHDQFFTDKTPSPTIAQKSDQTTPKIDYSPGTPADNADNNQRKESESKDQSGTLNQPVSDGSVQITANNTSTVDDNIRVGTSVTGATSGTCVATFKLESNAAIVVTTSSNVTQLVNGNYSCGTLQASKASFTTKGSYSVSVMLGSAKSNSLSGVNIQ